MRKKKPTSRLLMVVDGSNLAHRAYQKFTKLKSREGVGTGMVYGFLRLLHSYLFRFKPTYLIVTFDTKESKLSNFRNKLLEGYKNHRGKISMDYEDFNRQLRLTKRILVHMNIPVIYDIKGLGFESDDYIAYCALNHKGKVLIVSGDKDFTQLIDERVKIFNPGKEKVVNAQNCESIMGYSPEHCVDYLSLVGDSSDDIPGYYGIGPKKAEQFLKEFDSIEKFLEDGGEFKGIDPVILDVVASRNEQLIDLRYSVSKIKKVPYIYNKSNALQEDKLIAIFKKYTLLSFASNKDFISTFKTVKPWQLGE